jgi:hypothetical protein
MLKPPSSPPDAPAHLARPEAQLWRELVRTYRFDDPASLELLTQAMEARGRAKSRRMSVLLFPPLSGSYFLRRT